MQCRNHPNVSATDRCTGCAEPFCPNCLVQVHGQNYCASCKMMTVKGPPPPPASRSREILTQARDALLLSIFGLFCCAIIFEPMALSKASEAKRLIDADHRLDGRGMATAAQVIAVIGLVIWALGLLAKFFVRSQA
jgi:hypothetical protein